MEHALDGGLWFHRHAHHGELMAHLVSSDKQLLLRVGRLLGMRPQWLQYKPLKNPRSNRRVQAWHWDLRGLYLDAGLKLVGPKVEAGGEARVGTLS
jgi:hypothetical protein